MRTFGGWVVGLLLALTFAAPVAQADWLPAGQLRPDGVVAGSPVTAAGFDGTAVVAWVRAGNVEAAIKPAGGAFGPAQTVGAGSQPHVAVDDSGRVLVAWDAGDDVAIAERPPGGQLGAADVAVDLTAVDQVSLAITAGGRALLGWSTPAQRGLSTRAPGAGAFTLAWSQATTNSTTSIAVGADGPAEAAWLLLAEKQATTTRVLARRWTTAGAETFQTLREVTDASTMFNSTSYSSFGATVTGRDHAVLLWRDDSVSTTLGLSSRSYALQRAISTGGSLAATGTLAFTSSILFTTASLSAPVVNAGPAHAIVGYLAYSQSTLPTLTTTYAVGGARESAGAFDPATSIASSTSSVLGVPGVAALPGDRGLFVNSNGNSVEAAIRTTGGAPGPLTTVAGDGGSAVNGLVATGDGDGGALGAWALTSAPSALKVALFDETPPAAGTITPPAAPVAGAAADYTSTAADRWTPVTLKWAMGDGTSLTGRTVSHVYATAGSYTVSVTATDAAGNSATASRQVTVTVPTPVAPSGGEAPVISGAKLSRARFAVAGASSSAKKRKAPRGATLSFRLSEPATVTAAVTRTVRGWRSGTRCAAKKPKSGKARRCDRSLQAGSLTLTGVAGANSVAFTGRIGRRALTPRAYGLTLSAKDAAGQTSAPVALKFTIVR